MAELEEYWLSASRNSDLLESSGNMKELTAFLGQMGKDDALRAALILLWRLSKRNAKLEKEVWSLLEKRDDDGRT